MEKEKTSRRDFIALGFWICVGATIFLGASNSYLYNKRNERLKPRNNEIPADLHVHLFKDSDPKKLREVLSNEGLVGLTTYSNANNLLSYYELEAKTHLYPWFKKIDPGILGEVNYNGNTGYVLNALEVMTKYHISALGCKENITAKTPEEAIKEIRKQNGIAILNHPYIVPSGKWFPLSETKYRIINQEEEKKIKELASLVDEVETFNGQCIPLIPGKIDMRKANDMAKDIIKDYKYLKGIATSDAHMRFEQILTSGIYIPKENLTFKKLKDIIKDKDFKSEEHYVSRDSFLKSHFPWLDPII